MTSLSRRTLLASLPAAGLLSACMTGRATPSSAEGAASALVNGPPLGRVPAAGFVVMDGNGVIASHAAGFASGLSADEMVAGVAQRPFSITSPFRTASVSKVVTALTALSLHKQGTIDLDAPLPDTLPGLAGRADDVTLRHLLAHTSGLTDPEEYWVAHPGSVAPKMLAAFEGRTRPAGEYFEYCNFGYGIAATALEAASGTRFDQLSATRVLKPMGLDAGFNWAGVSDAKRRAGATLYRETDAGWQVQTDGPDTLTRDGPTILIDDGASLDTYTPGQNGTLFSPQGGLRISLADLALMIRALKDAPELTAPVWTLNQTETNGYHDERYFTAFGSGIHIHPAEESLWPGHTLLGHHGEAYGLYAGAWYAPDLDLSFAYAVTGTPDRAPIRSTIHPALNEKTEPLVMAACKAAGLA